MLEQLYVTSWIERNVHAVFVGFIYSVIGIFVSLILFPKYAGAVSLGFIAVLLLPTLNAFLKSSEQKELREKTFSIPRFYKDHKDVLKSTLFLFFGIFIAYTLVGLIFSSEIVSGSFAPQLNAVGVKGFAFHSTNFSRIILNNTIVFVLCFIISLAFGAGSILFLTWNASVWGLALAYFVKEAAIVTGGNPLAIFFSISLPFLPHMVTEALAYVGAAIVGGIVSKGVINEDFHSLRFRRIIRDSLLFMGFGFCLVLIAGFIEVYFFPAM